MKICECCKQQIKRQGSRTLPQNAAMHKYFTVLAKMLNEGGHDKRAVFEQMRAGVEVPWSAESIKEDLWRPIQAALTKKSSSTQLEWDEVSIVYDTLNRWISDKFNGLYVPFPSRDDTQE